MPVQTLKARYVNGALWLPEEINFPEGKEVIIGIEHDLPAIDAESREWLYADLAGELPPTNGDMRAFPKESPFNILLTRALSSLYKSDVQEGV